MQLSLPETLNLLSAEEACRTQKAARAFLVFIFRQREIWPTLANTKEQHQQFAHD